MITRIRPPPPPSHSLVPSQYQKFGTEPNTLVSTGVDLEFVREEIVEVDDDIFVDAEINTVKNMVSLEDAGKVVIELEHFFKQLVCPAAAREELDLCTVVSPDYMLKFNVNMNHDTVHVCMSTV